MWSRCVNLEIDLDPQGPKNIENSSWKTHESGATDVSEIRHLKIHWGGGENLPVMTEHRGYLDSTETYSTY